MPAADNKVHIYIGPPLREALDAAPSDNRSGRINTVAERYLDVVRRSTPALTVADWCALCNILNSTVRDPLLARALAGEAAEALADGIAEKWELDGAAWVARIEVMTAAERIAVLEIVDRYWAQERHSAGHEAALKAAGARITP